MKRTLTVTAMVVALALGSMSGAIASTTIYDTIPDPLPSNVVSLGFLATETAEFGQKVSLDEATTADSLTVVMSSWTCADWEDGVIWTGGCGEIGDDEYYTHPITANIYEDADNGVGDLIMSVTQDINVPFRPAADETCETTTNWRDEADDCFSGFAFTANFDLGSVDLPADFVFSIAFDTPQDSPAGSLNVGLDPVEASDGDFYWVLKNGGVFTFTWTFNIMARFEMASAEITVDDCKNGGFADLGFRNQGQCIASIVANENAGK